MSQRLLSSGSIRTQFIIILILMSGLAVVGGYSLISVQDEYESLLDQGVATEDETHELEIQLLLARRAEKDFMLRAEIDKIEKAIGHIGQMRNHTSEIIEIAVTADIKNNATRIAVLTNTYSQLFTEVSDHMIERGGGTFGADNGLVGEMREEAHHSADIVEALYVDDKINETMYNRFMVEYLQTRRGEKDYLLRYQDPTLDDNGLKYADRVELYISGMVNVTNDFPNTVEAANISLILESLNHYTLSFDAILAIDAEIAGDIANFRAAVHKIEDDLDFMLADVNEFIVIQKQETDDFVNNSIRGTIIIFVIAFAITFFVATRTSRNIVDPLATLNGEVKEMASGDLTRNVEYKTKPNTEIIELTNNFNAMTGALSGVIGTVRDTSTTITNSAEQLSSASEEVNASAEEISSTSQAMSTGATNQAELISQIVEDMDEAVGLINNIITQVQSNTELVTEIAQETKYLALNARIEAARAGASGRGFSVVAEDVKNLSEQSKVASEEVNSVVDTITTTLREFFDNIRLKIDNVASVAEETAASAQEVAAASEEMTATMEEVSSSANSLAELAIESNNNVQKFKVKK